MKKKLSIIELKERLDNCIDLYTDLFCKKQTKITPAHYNLGKLTIIEQ